MITGLVSVTDPRMSDERRTIRELNSTPGGFVYQRFEIRQTKAPLGKHAHRFKNEYFLILSGSGYFLVAEVDPKGNIVSPPQKVIFGPNSVICFNRLEAHTLYPLTEMEMICFGNQPFFDEDKDFVDCPSLIIDNYPELAE